MSEDPFQQNSPPESLLNGDAFPRFCRVIHRSLNLDEAGTIIANEARLLSGVDRVSVAIRRGAGVRLIAASGVEKVVQRSEETRLLTALCATVLKLGQSVEWSTATPDTPDALEKPLAEYVRISHLRGATMIPLSDVPAIDRDDDPAYARFKNNRPQPLGVVLFEQYSSAEIRDDDRQLRHLMSDQIAASLSNARLHSSIFLRRPLLAVGRLLSWFRGRRLAIGAAVGLLLAVFSVCCVVVPREYKVTCDGVLITETRQDVFAPESGIVDAVFVTHNADVVAGTPLLQLRNDELEARQAVADARVGELQKLIRSYASQINLSEQRGDADASTRLQGDLKRTEIELHGAQESLRLLNDQISSLTVRAPSGGRIATFQLRQEILNRPVTRGDRLLQVYPEDGPWILELRVPEYRSGYVIDGLKRGQPDVEFILATHVELTRFAVLNEAATIVETSEDEGTIVVVRARLKAPDSIPDLNYGSECHARIHCGKQPLGWCLFGDVVEFLQRHFWI